MSSRNKYLLISPAFPPPFVGGSRVWTYNMVEYCPEVFDILTSGLKSGCEEVCGPKHRVFRSKFIWDSQVHDPSVSELFVSYAYIVLWLFWRLLTVRYQGVVAGAFVFANGLIFLVCRLMRVPCIGLGNAEEFTLVLRGKGVKNRIKKPWLGYTHKLANGFIVSNRFCKAILVGIGLRVDRIDVVPAYVSSKKLPHVQRSLSRCQRILSVGRLVERKGFHYLIDAVALLRHEFPEIKTTIVGHGPFKPVLLRKIRDLELHDRVEIRDAVDDEELSRLYRESSVFVLAHMMLDNGDTEGCPLVFSEAASYGLPLVGGTGGGAETLIVDGKTGFIVESRDIESLSDRIRTILRQPELAESLGRAAMEKVKRDHTVEATREKFLGAIRRFSVV